MFVGRQKELDNLEELYSKNEFEMVVVYGRRRIGKTTLLSKFVKHKRALFFTAQEAADTLNLAEFSKAIYSAFSLPSSLGPFQSWVEAFAFLADKTKEEQFVLVFDEFPYAANANRALCSILQTQIDHFLRKSKLFLILCGSQVSFMETEVLGYKSPLFGRRTAQIELHGLDYYDAGLLLKGFSNIDKLRLYSCIGGTPHYLMQVDQDKSVEDNLTRLYFDISGYLYNEPMMLLRQELREPAIYNSIIAVIAGGATRLNEIASKLHTVSNRLTRYIDTLLSLRLIKKICPFNENPAKSRKTQYVLDDNCYLFWYRFVFANLAEIENGNGATAAQYGVYGERLSDYIGKPPFEEICRQFLRRLNTKGGTPFDGVNFGTWWGNDNKLQQQTDVDVVMANKYEGSVLLGECNWRNEINEQQEIAKLMQKGELFPDFQQRYYAFFSKVDYSTSAKQIKAQHNNLALYTVDDMFDLIN